MQTTIRRTAAAAFLLLIAALRQSASAQAVRAPNLTLHGTVTVADAQTYRSEICIVESFVQGSMSFRCLQEGSNYSVGTSLITSEESRQL